MSCFSFLLNEPASVYPDIISLVDVNEDADAVHSVTELYRGGGMFSKTVEKLRQSRSSRSLGGSTPSTLSTATSSQRTSMEAFALSCPLFLLYQ